MGFNLYTRRGRKAYGAICLAFAVMFTVATTMEAGPLRNLFRGRSFSSAPAASGCYTDANGNEICPAQARASVATSPQVVVTKVVDAASGVVTRTVTRNGRYTVLPRNRSAQVQSYGSGGGGYSSLPPLAAGETFVGWGGPPRAVRSQARAVGDGDDCCECYERGYQDGLNAARQAREAGQVGSRPAKQKPPQQEPLSVTRPVALTVTRPMALAVHRPTDKPTVLLAAL